jgi:hypothetical protein
MSKHITATTTRRTQRFYWKIDVCEINQKQPKPGNYTAISTRQKNGVGCLCPPQKYNKYKVTYVYSGSVLTLTVIGCKNPSVCVHSK